ncbi:MAG: uncharacterized protein KVP18_005039 [Porospora cf. gigantea A]|uniref:uncharacterized protein n=1 Tax=Porospora cf. gigantea A TaxID=2853593 RepID=UPI00355A6C1B|nr:MAG: hypothetical protein KVP18_005039 [Porospora cf. gigantea A]
MDMQQRRKDSVVRQICPATATKANPLSLGATWTQALMTPPLKTCPIPSSTRFHEYMDQNTKRMVIGAQIVSVSRAMLLR